MAYTSLQPKPMAYLGLSLFLFLYFITTTYLIILLRAVFNDFGPKFTCIDPSGEQPLTGMIVSVDKVCDHWSCPTEVRLSKICRIRRLW